MKTDNRTHTICLSTCPHLKKVMMTFEDGTKKFLLLTEDQIKFFDWLDDHYLLADEVSIYEMEDAIYETI